jgi:hypothetical protein
VRVRRPLWVIVLAAVELVSAGGTVTDFTAKVPAKVGPWQADGKDRTFDRRTLYDYLDGGAEVYLAFDFRRAWVRRYAAPGGREINLDVYEMGSPAEAFGLFSSDRQDPGAGIGQDSEYGPGLLRFWQGPYFVAVTVSADDEASAESVLELGREVAKLLGPPGPKPDLLALLPEASLRPDRTSYFHGVVSLNNRFFVSGDNILRLDGTTACVLAEYALSPDGSANLLIVRYGDAGKAVAARRSFLASYIPDGGPDGTARRENGKWTSASLHDQYVAIVFDAPSPEAARKLAAAVQFPEK